MAGSHRAGRPGGPWRKAPTSRPDPWRRASSVEQMGAPLLGAAWAVAGRDAGGDRDACHRARQRLLRGLAALEVRAHTGGRRRRRGGRGRGGVVRCGASCWCVGCPRWSSQLARRSPASRPGARAYHAAGGVLGQQPRNNGGRRDCVRAAGQHRQPCNVLSRPWRPSRSCMQRLRPQQSLAALSPPGERLAEPAANGAHHRSSSSSAADLAGGDPKRRIEELGPRRENAAFWKTARRA
jgi:hypothetical protein